MGEDTPELGRADGARRVPVAEPASSRATFYIGIGSEPITPGKPIDRAGEVRSAPLTIDGFLRDGANVAGELRRLMAPGPFTSMIAASLGQYPPPTRAQRVRRRVLGRLDRAFVRLDRWRDRHGIGPEYPE